MPPQCVILTPAPGRVFLRTNTSFVEMEPGEALRLAERIRACVTTALAVQDGTALLEMIARP